MLNVFATPGDVFEEVKAGKPSTANWLVPLLLSCLAAVIFVCVVFSQETILRPMREAQEKSVQKQIDAGRMSKEQGQQTIDAMEKFISPAFLKIAGSIGAVLSSFALLFLIALVIWLLGTKGLKGQFSYLQAVEMTSLAGMINVLGVMIAMLLAVAMGSLAMTPGPALLIHDFDPASRLHRLLGQLNITVLWYVGVLALGLAKLSGVSFARAAWWAFGIWAAIVALAVLPGWGR